MGLFKKFKKSVNKVGNATTSAAGSASSGIVQGAGEIRKLGAKAYADIGKIEGYVEKGYSITKGGLNQAVNEVEKFTDDLANFLSKLSLAIYKAAVKPVEKTANDMAGAARVIAGTSGNSIDKIANQLLQGRFDQAMATTRAVMGSSNSDLRKFCAAHKPWGQASLVISINLAVGANVASASGSVGISIGLDPTRDVEACIFVGGGASAVAGENTSEGSITIGFVKGSPKNVGGPGIDLSVGPFGFSFPCDLSLITHPNVSGLGYSLSFEEFAELAKGTPPKVEITSASLGSSYSQILQTIKRANVSLPDPRFRDSLTNSEWVSTAGDRLKLVFIGRSKKKGRDWFSVTHNGTLKDEELRKLKGYDRHDDDVTTWNGARKSQIAVGRFTREANELVLRGSETLHWFRVET